MLKNTAMKKNILFLTIFFLHDSFACYQVLINWRLKQYQQHEAKYLVTKGNKAKDIIIDPNQWAIGHLQRHRKVTEPAINWRLQIESMENNCLATAINLNWVPLRENPLIEILTWTLTSHCLGSAQLKLEKFNNNIIIETQHIKVTIKERNNR